VEQLAIVARLKDGTEPRAQELIANGAPFDPAGEGLARHTVYISAGEVVFVFEGHEVEWIVDGVITDPYRWTVSKAFDAWRPIIEGEPRIARVAYRWDRDAGITTTDA
jgi:hypothetical protein